MYLIFIFFPVAQLGFIITPVRTSRGIGHTHFEILDARSDVTDKADAIDLPQVEAISTLKMSLSVMWVEARRFWTRSTLKPNPARRLPCWRDRLRQDEHY